MNTLNKLNRRDFLKITGIGTAGFTLQASLSSCDSSTKNEIAKLNSITGSALSLNVFVHIATNNRVTIMAHRSEMGQGIKTSLPQVVADELDADWDKVDVLQAEGDQKYGDQETDGSHSVRSYYQTMREMGASAKYMLRQAAAELWKVPLESCDAKKHKVVHLPTGKILSYGELAEAAAKQKIPDAKQLTFKSPAEYNFIGKPIASVDLQHMVRGVANYGIDTIVPGMVHASIERCPVLGGKVKSFDASKTKIVAGVIDVIKIDGGVKPAGFHPLAGVAVIATNTWAALEGRKQLKVDWDIGEHGSYDSRATSAQLVETRPDNAKVVRNRGDVDAAFSSAAKIHEAVYNLPYLEHATMEPAAATVRIADGVCEVWACTQNPQEVRKHVAEITGINAENVRVNVTLLGGAFGRKAKSDFVAEAALLAKKIGKPVKVTWSREDSIRNGYYHAHSVQHFKAALDKDQKVIAIAANVASPSISSLFRNDATQLQEFEVGQGFANTPCNTPNLRYTNSPVTAHTRIGWLRSVYNINHAFTYNSFVDELAHLTQRDPLEFQLDIIGSDRDIETKSEGLANQNPADFPFRTARLKNVLNVVKKSCGWPASVNAGEGWGIAAHHSFYSYVAVATKIHLEKNELRIQEVHIALDCGQILNPDRVHSQMEGSVIFGLSGALFGEITFKNGAVEQSSFDNYPLLRIHQCPKIIVTLISSDEKHSGVGEPGVPPIAASVTNAIVAAGGPRIRSLPLVKHLQIV
ncbi:MAG: molybdopterin cofactor-binding domain-containing protein [Cellvibrio sp.]